MKRLNNLIILLLLVSCTVSKGQVQKEEYEEELYSELVNRFTIKSAFDSRMDSTGMPSITLDTNEYYSITFKELDDTGHVFDAFPNHQIIYYNGFRNVHKRIYGSEIYDNMGIPYLIKAGKPYDWFEPYMNDGIIIRNIQTGDMKFISGYLVLDDFFEKGLRNNIFNEEQFLEIIHWRYFNYAPTRVNKLRNRKYSFYSGRTSSTYEVNISDDFNFILTEKDW